MNKRTPKMIVGSLLAFMAMAYFGFVIWRLTDHAIPVENKDFFNIALMALISAVSTGFGFFLGSSYGSARKTELTQGGPE